MEKIITWNILPGDVLLGNQTTFVIVLSVEKQILRTNLDGTTVGRMRFTFFEQDEVSFEEVTVKIPCKPTITLLSRAE